MNCGFATLEQCLPTYAGLVGTADPVRTRPRQHHVRRLGARDAKATALRNSSGSLAILLAIRRTSISAKEELFAHGPC
jgi:hypothetical protein